VSLRARLIALLSATAAFAIALALAFQDRSLTHDLERAAAARLERSAAAANRLVDAHLAGLVERYRAISGTPQLRANLEVEDPPTLAHFAEDLRARVGATRLAFADVHGHIVAGAGDPSEDLALRAADGPRLLAHEGWLHALVAVDVGPADEPAGRLLALEPVSPETLDGWTELCGAHLALGPEHPPEPGTLRARVRVVDGLELFVESTLEAEHDALRRSRALLLAAGALALAGALAASAVLSRGLAAAMRELLGVAERIGGGDLGARSRIRRSDEVGDLARAVNEMAERLQAHGRALLAQHSELREAKDRAEAASRAKTEFLANVSHEIRTPMTAVLGYTDLLLGGEGGGAERAEWAAAVRRNGAHLLELIDGILDVSRLESERLVLAPRPCGLRPLLAEVAEKERPSALAKGLEFSVELGAECPETIATDPARLRQILGHLLRNAVKFTAAGRVRLRVGRAPGSASRLVFEVTDSGIGIAPGDRERIFDPFGQADASHTRRFGGVGLGLAVSRRLAVLLGGTLDVKSELGAGSSFRLEIEAPAAALEPAPPSTPPAPHPGAERGARVLVAEDGPDNQRLIRALLRSACAELVLVENGAEAVEHARAAWDAGAPFDLILMDMQMPVLDGYEATRRLRDAGYTGRIVALTAHAMTGDRERCLGAGCDDYLTKPIDRARLLAAVANARAEAKPEEDAPRC